jgi:NAD(P)-dependent dehydrogenase (short-subunit alcohol dehydrogenase family)
MKRFADKVAIVTGGSSGIGKATAIAFAREGAAVAIAARRQKPGLETVDQIKHAGGNAVFIPTDVSKSEDIERLITTTVEKFGRLDYAFNNAARTDENAARTDEVIGPMTDLSEEDFDRTVGVNLKGVWLGMKYQIRQMLMQEPKGGANRLNP